MRRPAFGIMTALGTALAAACVRGAPADGASATGDEPAAAAPAAVAEGRVPLTRLRAEPYSYTYSSGFVDSTQRIVRDTAAWAVLWAQIHARHGEQPPRPGFDPAREQLVLVALGRRATGGFTILLDSAVASRDSLLIHVTTAAPGPRCGTTAALTEPVDVARMPRVTLPARFVTRATVTSCP